MQHTEVGEAGGATRRDLNWCKKLYRLAGSPAGSVGSGEEGGTEVKIE